MTETTVVNETNQSPEDKAQAILTSAKNRFESLKQILRPDFLEDGDLDTVGGIGMYLSMDDDMYHPNPQLIAEETITDDIPTLHHRNLRFIRMSQTDNGFSVEIARNAQSVRSLAGLSPIELAEKTLPGIALREANLGVMTLNNKPLELAGEAHHAATDMPGADEVPMLDTLSEVMDLLHSAPIRKTLTGSQS